MRAVTIPPMRVASVVPSDLNIVLERLEPPSDMRFDVIVATNILVYYDAFEQALALANIAAMLRPGGILMSNTPVPPTAEMKLSERFTHCVVQRPPARLRVLVHAAVDPPV